MPIAHIGVYLNDHLAGSVVALELMDHLEKSHAGTGIKDFLVNLRAEILADREELEALMGRLEISPNPRRKAMAWFTEKIAEIKLSLDDPAGGPLHLLEALEAIAIGIDGKRALWRALAAARTSGLTEPDYRRLERRAEDQRDRIETARLEAAKVALRDEDQPHVD
jgi:hypothetical protein